MVGLVQRQRAHKRTFTSVGAPLKLPANQSVFVPWAKKTTTCDAGTIGEAHKKAQALDPQKLAKVIAAMSDIGSRIEALEARRAAPQPAPTHDAPTNPLNGTLVTGITPGGGAMLIGADGGTTLISPTHRRPNGQPDTYAITPPTRDGVPRLFPKNKTKDTQMSTSRHNGLAPNRFITTHANQRGFNDAAYTTKFGEQPSRFDSREQARLASHAPGATLPSPAELNVVNQRAHASAGASGQAQDNVVAPGGEGGQPGILKRGGMLEASSSDLSEAFASKLDKIPSGQPQQALNAYHSAYYKAKTPAARDAIDKIWSAFQRR